MSEQIIRDFIKLWFSQFDILDKAENFTRYLSRDVKLSFPEGEFRGEQGFLKCYDGVKEFIKPNNLHTITDIAISLNENDTYKVNFHSNVKGESPQGEALNLDVDEEWNVRVENEKVEILTYRVIV